MLVSSCIQKSFQLTETTFKTLDWMARTLCFTLPFSMLAYPFYMLAASVEVLRKAQL
ncbi:hypothetical protein HanXRQr2_Chr14g0670391 [Helianthus annuus]|uniref:Uncharacterized protein n=1 Tax=Helianthus annuus TaxID=4232 RepID=A0A251SMQ2_HELAN|nr:hypothetical protein HanXRQr2_Chr14g0670391 [Helianthus annuus]